MCEYKIVGGSANYVEECVTDMLNQGWQLYGNPLMGGNGYFAQAVIRQQAIEPAEVPPKPY